MFVIKLFSSLFLILLLMFSVIVYFENKDEEERLNNQKRVYMFTDQVDCKYYKQNENIYKQCKNDDIIHIVYRKPLASYTDTTTPIITF